MRYDRALAISKRHQTLLALVKSGAYSSDALAKKLEVSIPTIYRDVLFLKRQGYPIESARSASAWAYQLASRKESKDRRQGAQSR
jgi:DeoR/GlpR family transcriptional regulator of sugar metabolism